MKRFSKALLVMVLALAMVLNTCGIVLANVTAPTVTVTEEVVDETNRINKLVFTLTLPAGSALVNSAAGVFSFDNTVIQPVNKSGTHADITFTNTATNADKKKPVYVYQNLDGDTDGNFSSNVYVNVVGTRTGVKFESFTNDPDTYAADATGGMMICEFYYRVLDENAINGETFKTETTGEIFEGLFNEIGTAYAINIGCNGGAKYYYGTPSETDVEAIARPTFEYTGSDRLVLGSVEISPLETSEVEVPVVYTAEGSTNAVAAILELEAVAKSTRWSEGEPDMTVSDKAVWTIDNWSSANDPKVSFAGTGANATLTVQPGALSQEITVKVVDGGKEDTEVIKIERKAGAPAATYIEVKDGSEVVGEKITVVKPAVEGDPTTKTLTAVVYDQYGETITPEAGELTFTLTAGTTADAEITPAGVLTVPYGSNNGDSEVTATFRGVTKTFTVEVVGLKVNFETEVEQIKTELTYLETNESAIKLPEDKKGTASVNGLTVYGTYEVVDATDTQDAALEATITVKFIASGNTGDLEVYNGTEVTETYTVKINKANIDISGVVFESKAVDYTGDEAEIEVTGELPEQLEVSVSYEQFDKASDSYVAIAAKPVNASETAYKAIATFTVKDEYANNYNAPGAKTAELTINKADQTITVENEGLVENALEYTFDKEGKAVFATTDSTDNDKQIQVYYKGVDIEYDSCDKPYEAGTYKVTITAIETTNYKEAVEEVTLTIKPADADAFATTIEPYTTNAKEAAEDKFEALKAGLGLDRITTAEVSFGDGLTETVDIEWANPTIQWNDKSGEYIFLGTPINNTNLVFGDLKLEAKAIVKPVVGKLAAPLEDIVIKEGILAEINAISHTDIGFKNEIIINLLVDESQIDILKFVDVPEGSELGDAYGRLVWDIDYPALKAMLVDENKDVKMISTFPEWLTINEDLTVNFKVSRKDPVNVKVTQANGEYGEPLAVPEAIQVDAGFGMDAVESQQFTFTYTGTTAAGVAYESTAAPTEAGEYTVKAAVSEENPTYEGSGSATFTIAPKPIEVTIKPATKVYGEEPPEFELVQPIDGLVGDDVLGEVLRTAATKDSDVGEYDIVLESWADKNYAVTTPDGNGTLTITQKDLANTAFIPEISGDKANGSTLTIKAIEGLDASQYDVFWNDATEAAAGYTLGWADSNKTITAVIKGRGNYSGEKTSSNVYEIPTYEMEGNISTDINHEGGVSAEALDAGDEVTIDIADLVPVDAFAMYGASATYSWYLGDTASIEDATVIENAESDSYVVITGDTGHLFAKLTVSGNLTGEFINYVGEIGKIPLSGEIILEEANGAISIKSKTVSGEEGTDYELVWTIDGTDITEAVEAGVYTIVAGDYGKTVTVKAVAKGDVYSNEITATEVVDPIAPTVTIATSVGETTITVTVNAVENGAPVTNYTIDITDGGDPAYTDSYTGTANSYTFEGLTAGTAYTITATATNDAGTTTATATATPFVAVSSRPRPSNPTTTPTTPDTGDNEGEGEGTGEGTTTPEADVTVKVEDTSATVDADIIKDNESVAVSTETESGTEVKTTVNIADANVASLEVSTKDSDKAAAGAAAEGLVGTPVEVKVDAKDAEGNAADVTVNVAIPSEEKAYAYIIDENGVATRTESVYNEETGEVEVANVPDGAVVMLSTTAPATFDDSAAHWAEDTINYAVDAGIMNGVGGSTFDPDGKATRGMVNAMMVRLAKVAGVEFAEAADQKVDTDTAHWAAATDLIALANGWSTGVRTLEDGTVVMDTDSTVTREQLVTMLWRFVGNPEAEGEIATFDDHADTADWAKDAKAWAVGAGIINGKPGNKLDPNGTATRAEIATMFNRLMNYMTK